MLSIFINRPRIVIINKVTSVFRYVRVFADYFVYYPHKSEAGRLGKRKTDSSAREHTRKLHTS